MSVVITKEVKCCKECPYLFCYVDTRAEEKGTLYGCEKGPFVDNVDIVDPYCPFKEKEKFRTKSIDK